MPEGDTDYNPAIRREVKDEAQTGRTFKKWKHRAQGAAVGSAGTVAAILARKPLAKAGKAIARVVGKKFSSVPRGTTQMSEIFGLAPTTNLSLHGGFKDMLESAVKLKKTHLKAWKEMSPKEREANRAELRTHRDAINDQERAADSTYSSSFMSSAEESTSFDQGEKHPGDLPMDPATLRRKKLNAGQTVQQKPLMPQEPLVRIKSMTGKVRFSDDRRTFFASDANGRPHSSAGTFEPEVDGVTSQSIQRAYSPKDRLTGRPPIKSSLQRQIAKRALARIAASTEL